jgi:hypothetical protein
MWAITPKGIGKAVGARRIKFGWELTADETFIVEDFDPSTVLAEDEISLRQPTQAELDAINNPVPQSVSRAQGEIAMLRAGVLSAVETLMADPTADPEMVIAWNRASEFKRNSTMIASAATALGWSDIQIDDLFRVASTVDL